MAENKYPNIMKIAKNIPVAFEDKNGQIFKIRKGIVDYVPLDSENDDSEEILVLIAWAEGVPSPFDVYEEDVKRVILEDKPKT